MKAVTRKVHKVCNPTNLNEAVFLTSVYLKLSGLFPYSWVENRFKLSPFGLAITFLHIFVFSFVNVKLIYQDIEEYSSPIIYNNDIGIAGQFVLKVLGVFITFVIFFVVIFGTSSSTELLNRSLNTLHQLEEMGIDIRPIYRRIFIFTVIQTLVIIVMAIWTLADGMVFFHKMNDSFPTLEYFFVDILSNLYKYCGLMNMCTYLYVVRVIVDFVGCKLDGLSKK